MRDRKPDPDAGQTVSLGKRAQDSNVRTVAISIDPANCCIVANELDVSLVDNNQNVVGYPIKEPIEIVLPEASVAVQVSGTFGSRQEEAQRLGRLLRPKHDGGGALFYSVVARDSLDTDYAAHRQRFLAEQGYGYIITDADDLLGPAI